ncbi:PRC-barrel domain containing protein [Alteromonadaceae bacterium BrNp21-10]|nr:PRC-barrel domain containing protein [Alteromonadaceae bacterium BrNp21-10]
MLVSLKTLNGSSIQATDGDVGHVKDVYFDDEFWIIRFVVADTHPWMPLSEQVLISPIAIKEYDADEGELNVSLEKEMVRDCPKIEEHETVSRDFEKAYFDYFGFGYYWTGPGAWGEYAYPTALIKRSMLSYDSVQEDNKKDNTQQKNHLRSANEIAHYGIDAIDGKKGYLKDFIWDTHTWSLRYLVVDTRDWLPGGKKVLITPKQLNNLSWEDKTVSCNIDLATIEACPEYLPDQLNDDVYQQQVQEKLRATA